MRPADAPPRGDEPLLTTIRSMQERDLDAVAALHARSLGHGLFPALGTGFLRRYLATYLSSAHAVAFVAERDGSPCGYIVGTLDPASHRSEVLREHGASLAIGGVSGLARRPLVAVWFVRTRALRYATGVVRTLRRRGASGLTGATTAAAVLNHVAVHPEARGLDVGTELVAAFLDAVREAGMGAARLVTRAEADGAGPFYRRLGWALVGTYVDQDGLAWDRYEVAVR